MDIVTAWNIWVSGVTIPAGVEIFGLKTTWWIRIAEALQLVSGMVILIDIIGIQKLRKLGNALHRLYSIKELIRAPSIVITIKRLRGLAKTLRALGKELTRLQEIPKTTTSVKYVGETSIGRYIGRVETIHQNPNYSSEKNCEIRAKRNTLEAQKAGLELQRSELRISLPAQILFEVFALLLALEIFLQFIKYLESIPTEFQFLGLLLVLLLAYPLGNSLALIILTALIRVPALVLETFVIEPLAYLLRYPRLKQLLLILSLVLFLIGAFIQIFLS